MKVNFEEVSIKGVKKYRDESGKIRQKTKKFYQTINPFNKNADGSQKTRSEIFEEIKLERAAWIKD